MDNNLPPSTNESNNTPSNSQQAPGNQFVHNQSSSSKKWFVPTLLGLTIVSLVITAFFAYQNTHLKNSVTNVTPTTNQSTSLTPTLQAQNSISPASQKQTSKKFTFQQFSILYPSDWTILENISDKNFPLKERIRPLYKSDKAIAFSKNDSHLIITIEKEKEGSSGGIFVDDKDYSDFLSNKDQFTIQESPFFISRDHQSISSLIDSHGGPYTWSAVAEYIPNKRTESGQVYKGYEYVIKRNGYDYNFIITSTKGGTTDPQLQKEIVSMLETITW